MAEELDPERAKFEEDVLKAAEAAMKMEKEASAAVDGDAKANDGDATSTEEKPTDDAAKSSENAPEDSIAEQAPEQSIESEEEKLKAELAAANDRNLRLIAEFDNFRRRSAKEQLDLIEVANGKLLEKFADVWENFDRAFAAENKGDLPSFEKGMQMIQTQFVKVLTDAGLEQIDPTGEEFDPNCHEALMQQPSETVPEGHVVTVFQKGYKLKNKILKTAKVIVSSGK